MRQEAQQLQDKVRVQLLEAANKCSESIAAAMPTDGTEISALVYAKIRWEMLKAGFKHAEVLGIISKLKAWQANHPGEKLSAYDFIQTVTVKYLEPIGEDTSAFDLYIYHGEYQDRIAGKILNAHERMVFLIGKQIDMLLAGKDPDQQARMVKRLAAKTDCSDELIWRIATGGLRVPRTVLEKVNKVVRELNANLAEDAENNGSDDAVS